MTTNTQDAKAAYETWHDRLAGDSDAETPWHRLVKTHLEPTRDLAGKRVLEIGCGRGGFACWLAKQPRRPTEIVAADFSATAVQKGRTFAAQHGLSGITWEVTNILAIDHPDA